MLEAAALFGALMLALALASIRAGAAKVRSQHQTIVFFVRSSQSWKAGCERWRRIALTGRP